MVRTRSFGVKVGGKSSKKTASSLGPAPSASSSSGSKKSENGNSIQVQPTPAWQREITGFLGNPAKKPRIDEESNDIAKGDGIETEKPEVGEDVSDSTVGDNSANGRKSPKENNDSADGKNSSEKKEKNLEKSGEASKGSVEISNGCKTLVKDSGVVEENVSLLKDTSKNEEKVGSVSPVLAEAENNIE